MRLVNRAAAPGQPGAFRRPGETRRDRHEWGQDALIAMTITDLLATCAKSAATAFAGATPLGRWMGAAAIGDPASAVLEPKA